MKKTNTGSLPESLKDVLDNLESTDSDAIESAYGTEEDVLVLVAQDKDLQDEFIYSIAHEVSDKMNETGEDIGFIISEGPDDLSDQKAAYVRKDPEEPREYIITFCDRLGLDRSSMAEISALADEEMESSNPRETAATLIADHQVRNPGGVSVGEVSKNTNVKISKLRELLMERSN